MRGSARVKEFMLSQGLSLLVLLDARDSTAQKYNIGTIPTTYFIDKDGVSQGIKIGAFLSKVEIESWLSRIMP